MTAHIFEEFSFLEQIDHLLRLDQPPRIDQQVRELPIHLLALAYQRSPELRLEVAGIAAHLLHDVDGAFAVQDRRIARVVFSQEPAVAGQRQRQMFRRFRRGERRHGLLEKAPRPVPVAEIPVRLRQQAGIHAKPIVVSSVDCEPQLTRPHQRFDRRSGTFLEQQRLANIVVSGAYLRTRFAQLGAANLEPAPIDAFRLGVPALLAVDEAEPDERVCSLRTMRIETLLENLQSLVKQFLGPVIVADVI